MKWLVLSKPKCARCSEAIDILKSKGKTVEVVDIKEDYDHWLKFITEELGCGEVPQIKSPKGEWYNIDGLREALKE